MSLRVLFVNDDPTMLSALRASLRRHRRQWDMQFVNGSGALRAIEVEPAFDVVVSELLFEGVDGHELLGLVATRHPGAVRVVLSAAVDPQGAMRATKVAHQYLSMPCDPRELILRIERSEKLRSLLHGDRIAALGSLDQLPSAPRVYQDLQAALADPQSTVNDVARVIERDQAMSAKVLQLVNSAFFSRVRRVANIRGAVSVLGLDLLQGLVLQQALYGGVSRLVDGLSLEVESQHGLTTALIARHICERVDSGVAFTAALVHDVGKLLLAERFGASYGEVLLAAEQPAADLSGLEGAHLRVTHGEAGAYLLGVWGLPDSVVEGVAWHHRPSEVTRVNLDVVACVHLADAIARRVPADPGLVEELELAEQLPRWRTWFDAQEAA